MKKMHIELEQTKLEETDKNLSPTKKNGGDESESSEEEKESEEEYHNQFTLIYPADRNPQEKYERYIEHAKRLYEQFTGSYSKKKTEETNPKIPNKS